MKHLLALSTLLFAASAVGAPPPQQGGEITVAIVVEPPGWDPTVSNSQEINRVTYGNVYEGLVMLNRHGEITPGLAESWEVSEDGLSWTFTLREGVTFHDGSTFTAEDVLAKFERARDPDAGHTHPEYYTAIDTVSAEGNTVTFTLTHPSASLLYNLARPSSIIYPAGTEETQRTAPVGTGPFRFAEWVRGSEVRLERFDDYHGESAYLDAVTFRIIEDPSAQLAALQAGDIDMVGVALSPENALQVQADPNLKLTEGSATTEITLAMNNAREPLSDLRVRQAITHAIDKQAIIEGALFGFGTPIGTHASPIEPYFIDVEPYPYDPERARELLAEAGFEDGLTLTFELPPTPSSAASARSSRSSSPTWVSPRTSPTSSGRPGSSASLRTPTMNSPSSATPNRATSASTATPSTTSATTTATCRRFWSRPNARWTKPNETSS